MQKYSSYKTVKLHALAVKYEMFYMFLFTYTTTYDFVKRKYVHLFLYITI